jgi:hypothetical protein
MADYSEQNESSETLFVAPYKLQGEGRCDDYYTTTIGHAVTGFACMYLCDDYGFAAATRNLDANYRDNNC